MTLFDHAEISRIASLQVLWDGLTLGRDNPLEVLKYAATTLQGWKPSLPVRYEWADNYISLVGFYLPNTMNVALQKASGYAGIRFWEAHSYPMNWYDLSIANPAYASNPLGFKRSFEYSRLSGVNLLFPPSVAELSPGDAYHQTPNAVEQLSLEPLPLQNFFQLVVPLFGNGADAIVQGVVGPIQIAGEVSSEGTSEKRERAVRFYSGSRFRDRRSAEWASGWTGRSRNSGFGPGTEGSGCLNQDSQC